MSLLTDKQKEIEKSLQQIEPLLTEFNKLKEEFIPLLIEEIYNSNALNQSSWNIETKTNSLNSNVDKHSKLAYFGQLNNNLIIDLDQYISLYVNNNDIIITFNNLTALKEFINTNNLKINLQSLLDDENKLQTELTQLQSLISKIKGKIST